jgi:hypothetical protein
MKSIRTPRPRCSPALAPSDGERVAAGRVRGRPRDDRGDIFINEGEALSDGSLNWTGTRKVNTDGTATDQWNPAIAVNPTGTQLFVGYYSRQDDLYNNALFDPFPIRNTSFPPLFPGTTTSTPPTSTWLYDHVWAQENVCLDANAMVVNSCDPNCCVTGEKVTSGSDYRNFMADDYTWASADGIYFYYAWCDRSLPYVAGGHSRPDANIFMGKVKQ